MTSVGITPEYQQEAEKLYMVVLEELVKSKLPFVIAGTYAVRHYARIDRATKDLDIFTTAGDYSKILKLFADKGYEVTIDDERWLSRIHKEQYFVDVIFGSIPGVWPITKEWIDRAEIGSILGFKVHMASPEELIISKAYRMKRDAFDGADVANIILHCGKKMDWHYLMMRMDQYWEVLLIHLLLYRFVYPSEREQVPRWVVDELLNRMKLQMELPAPQDKVSRGSILSWEDFRDAVEKWGYKDMTEFTFSEKKA